MNSLLTPPLVDSLGRVHNYLRVAITEKCNLRCVYCMPEQGVELTPSRQLLTDAEVIRLVRLFAKAGVTKVRLTGGEPMLHRSVIQLCRSIRSVEGVSKLGITTNGVLLRKFLPELKSAGVTALNISLDTLKPERFQAIARRDGLSDVLSAIDAAEALGFDSVKLNCVVLRGVNDDEVGDVAALAKSRPIEVRFIEYMPFDENEWEKSKLVPFMEMIDTIERKFGEKLIPKGRGETAALFGVPGHVGSLGFISSMTNLFCNKCNRLRVTSDGNFKTCLFGEDEVSLRDPIRSGASDEKLMELVRAALKKKHFSHGGKSVDEMAEKVASNRPMVKIGG